MALSGGTVAVLCCCIVTPLDICRNRRPSPKVRLALTGLGAHYAWTLFNSASAVTLCESLDSLPIVVRILGSGAIAARCLLARRRVHDENLPALTVLGHQHIHFGGSIHPLASCPDAPARSGPAAPQP